MQYNRDVKDPMVKLVNQALIDYREDIYDVSAGYAILRYTKRGLIGVSAEVNPQVFADWYPLDQGFIILRLAKEGKLFYKKQ